MTMLEPTESAPPIDAIGPHSAEVGPWRRKLTLYKRGVGGFMIVKGLSHWATLFGAGNGAGSYFQELPIDAQAATVFFAVIDLVAGVSLWLASTWGAILWLVAAGMQVLANMIVLELTGFQVLFTLIQLLLVAGYVIIRFQVHLETSRLR
jgi:hypothetical protein